MWKNFKKFIYGWLADDPFTQSAAVAYYAIFSMPGLLIIVMAIAALFFERQQVETEILSHVSSILGPRAANNIHNIVNQTQAGNRDFWAMIVGAVTLLFGATGVFAQLQRSLNNIWEVEVKKSARLLDFLKTRAAALGLILAIGFIMLISLTITAALTFLSEWLGTVFPPFFVQTVSWLNIILSFATVTILFTLIFKILPDAHVPWRPAFAGGALAALLFNVGQYALTYYFEIAEPQSAFGAAGSVVLLMLWVSYSCLILLIGAEFAKSRAKKSTGLPRANKIARKQKVQK